MCLPKKMTTDIASLEYEYQYFNLYLNEWPWTIFSDLDFQSHQVEILVSFTFETNHESEFLLTWLWI